MYILARKSTKPTARALGAALGIPVRITALSEPPTIRWGNSESRFVNEVGLNDPDHIHLSSNKIALHRVLEAMDIPHIPFYQTTPESFPVVVRTTISGSGGAGIVVCRTLEEWEPYRGHWWSPWYTFSFELGVHVLGGEVKRIFTKVGSESEEFPIRNMSRGYEFSLREPRHYPGLQRFVSTVYEAFPIKMARLDIGFERNRGFRVIEANSAPGLAENANTLAVYVEYLKRELKL